VRRRLDLELVRRGLATSRSEAQELVASGRVTVAGAPGTKPARLVDPAESVVVAGEGPRFVSRGGLKLEAALEQSGLDVGGALVLDAGASTGGFTDCLLHRGARRVVAIDVGRGQLHDRLRSDPRVDSRERTNVRHLDVAALAAPSEDGLVDGVVADLSFISLRTVLPALRRVLRDDGWMVLLVKPQFEAGRAIVGRGRGIVRDPAAWSAVLEQVAGSAVEAGTSIMDVVVAPIRGADGNVEFLLVLRATPGPGPFGEDERLAIDRAVRDAALREQHPVGGEDVTVDDLTGGAAS
jgi:23S rRNA (cytidine1920-2'-O)/16S rRNA (cytidine1409-2'-O)-methyltransferase